MSNELILVDCVSKKFHRTFVDACVASMRNSIRKICGLTSNQSLGKNEFWALHEVSFIVRRGECLGVIGPNGAGKTTLLKLIHREFGLDAGRLVTKGAVKSLIRIGMGLQPLLSGRENIYIQCQQMGLSKRETDLKLDEIIGFAGLEAAVDAPVKTYSDGMYARLGFAIATSVPMDILLVDEVLAVGDIAFQIRALDRLNQLKRAGAAIVFVSHSEMNVRHVADRCLLLFNGRMVAQGEPDALFYQYYASVGYLHRPLQPLGSTAVKPVDKSDVLRFLDSLALAALTVRVGEGLILPLEYMAIAEIVAASLVVQFWNAASILVASVDSALSDRVFRLGVGRGCVRVRMPFLGLTPGVYQIAAGFMLDGSWLAYHGRVAEVYVVDSAMSAYSGVVIMQAEFDGGFEYQ